MEPTKHVRADNPGMPRNGDEVSREDAGPIETLLAPFFHGRVVADQHYRQGIELQARGQWERALRSFRSACDLHPQKVLYLVARGRLCQEHDMADEAAACYAIARRLDPGDPVALFNEADLLARRGNLDGATANLRAILDRPPPTLGVRDVDVLRLLGDLELARGRPDESLDAYQRALAASPGDSWLTATVASTLRLREVAASADTAPRATAAGLRFEPKAEAYAFAGAMVLGLPDDDGIDVPSYPALGFVSVEEVASALARPIALLRRRRMPFKSVRAVEPPASPIATALGRILGIPVISWGATQGPMTEGPHLAVAVTGEDPDLLRASAGTNSSWTLSLGLRYPAWRYVGAVDAILVAAAIEVPWASPDARARAPQGDPGEALATALRSTLPDDDTIDRHLAWHASRARLAAGDPAIDYEPR